MRSYRGGLATVVGESSVMLMTDPSSGWQAAITATDQLSPSYSDMIPRVPSNTQTSKWSSVGDVSAWLSFVCVVVMIAVVPFLSGGFFPGVSCPERERQAEGEVKSRQHQNNVAASAINNSVTMIRLGISKLSPVCGAGVEAGVESVVGVPALLLLAAGDVGVTGSVIFVQEG